MGECVGLAIRDCMIKLHEESLMSLTLLTKKKKKEKKAE